MLDVNTSGCRISFDPHLHSQLCVLLLAEKTSRSEGNALMAQSRVEAVVKACSWEWEGNLHVQCRPNEPHITQKAQLWLLMSH